MNDWKYRIEPYGRRSWLIYVTNGLTQWGPNGGGFVCYGSLDRALRKAKRLVSKRIAEDGRREGFPVEGP